MTDKQPPGALASRAAGNPAALLGLARLVLSKGDRDQACRLAEAALEAAPGNPETALLAAEILSDDVHNWHFRIVRDTARNAAYEAALQRAVTPGTKVLEIGTGSGILAMMAARAGAKDVVTCEMRPAIAQAARDIIARNGYGDRVRVLAKKSFDVAVEADMGGRADIYVSEIVSNTIVGEGALPATEHAVAELLKPGARVIPARGLVRVALGYDAEAERERMGMIDGFDLSPFNRLATGHYHIKRGDRRLLLSSAPADMFDFDFRTGGPYPAAERSVTLTSGGGRANGIAQWIALQMDEEGWYENDPRPDARSAWAVIFWPFEREETFAAGTQVEVCGQHNRHRLLVWSKGATRPGA